RHGDAADEPPGVHGRLWRDRIHGRGRQPGADGCAAPARHDRGDGATRHPARADLGGNLPCGRAKLSVVDLRGPDRLDDRTRGLLARAERRARSREANEEIERERLRQQLAHGRSLSYEVVLGPNHGFAYLATLVAPKLASYLRDKRILPSSMDG